MPEKLTLKNLKLNETTYEGTIKAGNRRVEISIETAGAKTDVDDLIKTADAFLAWHEKNAAEPKKYAAKKLLKLKNKNWLEPHEKNLTESGFVKKMKLTSIGINSDKSIIIFYDDGGLFRGHSIIVEMDKNLKFRTADL